MDCIMIIISDIIVYFHAHSSNYLTNFVYLQLRSFKS